MKLDTIVIAAGGQGMRLAEYFRSISFRNTKTLFPVRDGQSTLEHLVDVGLAAGYKRIFILASFYEQEIKDFIQKKYDGAAVQVIFGGEPGRRIGVSKNLSFIQNELTQPFLYTDGDILFKKELLEILSDSRLSKEKMINCVISPDDMASTHSQFKVIGGQLKSINIRCAGLPGSPDAFCSLGLMVIDNSIFKLLPEYEDMGDLDLIVDKVFKLDNRKIGYYIYREPWFSLHKKEDIDIINN